MARLRQMGERISDDDVRTLSLVDVFEGLSQEEIEEITWKDLRTRVDPGETFYTPMDLCETLFVLREGRVRIFKSTPAGRDFTLAVIVSGTVFGDMALSFQRLRNSYLQSIEE